MSSSEVRLMSGENIIRDAKMYWSLQKVFLCEPGRLIWCGVALLFVAISFGVSKVIGIGAALWLLAYWIYSIVYIKMEYNKSLLVITNMRVIIIRFFKWRTITSDILLDEIDSMDVSQNAMSKKIGIGNIIISSKGNDYGFTDILDPLEIKTIIYETILKAKSQ